MSFGAGLHLAACALLLSACSRQSAAPDTAAPSSQAPGAAATAADPPPIDIVGAWQPEGPNDTLQVVGDKPALTPAGRKFVDAYRTAAARGDRSRDGTLRCLPPGTPRIMGIAQPLDINVDAHLVAMTFQFQRLIRLIYMDDAYPTNAAATFMGESHGRWDGNALVVESKNFKTDTLLDGTGLPHGTKLGLTERFELTDDDALIDHITISDDEFYQRPWQAQVVLKRRPGVPIVEDVCVERAGIHP